MPHIYKSIGLLMLFMVSLCCASQEQALEDIFIRYEDYQLSYYLNEDMTNTARHHTVTRVLDESVLKNAKKKSISYSASIEKAEVLKAYTLKADGTRLEVPKSNYQVKTNEGRAGASPLFSDRAGITVVFPDLEVGDAVVFTYQLTQIEPMFPGHFTAQGVFPKRYAYDKITVSLNVPQALNAKYKLNEMTETVREEGGRRIYEWQFKNPTPILDTRRDYSVSNSEEYPGFSYSTFSSYKEIVEAYAVRALPKASVTEPVRVLAARIIGDVTEPKEKARLLYEWVAKNITYAGHCIGVGAVVPHDIEFILENRMGDCKDQATLLQALLSAASIQSTQALINASNVYVLPEVPQVSAVNHVINYLPEFDVFLDATSQNSPFGMLPFAIADKPILLVDGFTEGARTPVTPIHQNEQIMKTTVSIDNEGGVSGNIDVALFGIPAVGARANFSRTTRQSEEEWLKKVFANEGHLGKAILRKDDPTLLLDRFHYDVAFEKKNFIQFFGAGAFHVVPFMPSGRPITSFLNVAAEIDEVDIACSNGSSTETYEIAFPENMEILAVPDDVTVDAAELTYRAQYLIDGNKLYVSKIFQDKTPRHICSPSLIKAQRTALQKVIRNIKSQVVYKINES